MRTTWVPVLLAAATVVTVATGGVADATVDRPVRSGDATIVDANNRTPIDHGGSGTEFSIALPEGAACPGDSMNDQWRIQSFIVPASDDPGRLTYDLIAPAGGGTRFALYDLRQNPYSQQLTQPNQSAGADGIIPPVVPLSFGVFPPGTIPSGTYRVGIACTYFRETARYWDTTIVVTDAADGGPSKFVWRLESAPESVLDDDGVSPVWWVGGAVLGACVIGLLWRRRRASTSGTSSRALQEHR